MEVRHAGCSNGQGNSSKHVFQKEKKKKKKKEEEKEGIGRDAVGYRDDKWRQKARENL